MTENVNAGNDRFFGLKPGVQYMLVGGLLFVFILLIIACTMCFALRIKNESDQKLVQRISSEEETPLDIDDINGTESITELELHIITGITFNILSRMLPQI